MFKLNFKKRAWIVKQSKKGISVNEIARYDLLWMTKIHKLVSYPELEKS